MEKATPYHHTTPRSMDSLVQNLQESIKSLRSGFELTMPKDWVRKYGPAIRSSCGTCWRCRGRRREGRAVSLVRSFA